MFKVTIHRIVVSCAAILWLFTGPANATSGFDGMEPLKSGPNSTSLPAELTRGDMTFGAALDPAKATDGELFTLFGAKAPGDGNPDRASYHEIVQSITMMFYQREGYIPSRLTPEVMAQAYGYQNAAQLQEAYPTGLNLDMLRSPITGQYPLLNAAEFSPGAFYFRPLSEDEKTWLGVKVPYFRGLFFQDTQVDPFTHEKMRVKVGAALYMRVYGSRGSIYEQVRMAYAQ